MNMKNAAFRLFMRQLAAYVGTGAAATVVDYLAFLLMFYAVGLAHIGAALIGYVIGGLVSYLLNRHYVFRSARSHHAAISRFLLVMAFGFILTGISMHLFVDYFFIPAVIARILTYVIVLGANFTGHRYFTFSR